MKEWFTAAELADEQLPGLPGTERNIRATAAREEWRAQQRAGRGGGLEYHFTALPITAQLILSQRTARISADIVALPAPSRRSSKPAQPRNVPFSALSESDQATAQARASVVMAYQMFRAANPVLSDRTCRLAFAEAWESGEVFVEPAVRELVRGTSPNTVRAWADALAAGGLAALAPKYGNRKGSGLIEQDTEMKQLLLGILADKPHSGGKKLKKALMARFPNRELPSMRSIERFMASWKQNNAQLLLRLTNPDAWRSKYQAASGDRSAGIVNPNDCWEADSTPADLMLSDGSRHKIIGIIDVAPRRLKLYVSKESCSTAIASTMRRCLIDWGVPSKLRIDNGSDYTSKHMYRVYDDLKIDVEVCPAFSPWYKPFIERSFRTFLHDLLEWLPGFIGHNVAERKDIESRRSFADRIMGRGETVEIPLTPQQLQDFCDQWSENVYLHQEHEGLKGKTPFQVVSAYTGAIKRIENERALDILLSSTSGDGGRDVRKKGVQMDNTFYDAPELGGLEGSHVRVLYDEADAGAVYVFAETGEFICRAIDPERLGVSRAELAQKRKARQAEVLKGQVDEAKKIVKEARVGDLVADILRDQASRAAKLAAMPNPVEPFSTPALEAAATAATAPSVAATRFDRQSRTVVALSQVREIDAKRARFARAKELAWKLAGNVPVEEADAAWLARYQATPEYRAFALIAADSE